MASIQIKQAAKTYGSVNVLHGVSLDIADGEFVILVGPSGCGKSTLLRMIAGLESISGGEIVIGDKVVNDLPPKARDIAMVFQSYALYPHMTVRDNMGFSLKLNRTPKADIDAKVQSAAAILGLVPLLDRKPAQLSGGQRQRVAMGRAIVRDPSVFLFDEPLSNLDAQLRVQMRAEIKSLHQRLKTTTVYVTHDQVEAMTMADRIVVMSAGHIEQMGSPLELFDRPANIFVARFIGSPSMNMLDGRLENVDGQISFVTGSLRVAVDGSLASAIGRDVVLGVRPEHVLFGAQPDCSQIEVDVSVVEPTGTETLLNVKSADISMLAVFKQRLELAPGDRIVLSIDPKLVHVFDKATGKRL